MEGVKRCSRCKESRPRAAFAKNKAARDGLQAYCRECWAEYHQTRQLAKGRNVRPRVKVPEGHKYCRSCGEIKSHSDWHRNATASDGLATCCKACKAAKGRAGHLKRSYGLTEAIKNGDAVSQKFTLKPVEITPITAAPAIEWKNTVRKIGPSAKARSLGSS